MSGRDSGHRRRSARGLTPAIEGLEKKDLLAPGAGPSIGSFLAAGTALPKVSGTSATVVPQSSVSELLSNMLGPGISQVQSTSARNTSSAGNLIANEVVNQPLVHALLSKQDTYDLLNSALADWDGVAGTAYEATGPILTSALETGSARPGPNAPRSVPGLRLTEALSRDHNLAGAEASGVLRAFRIAVARQVLTLSANQVAAVDAGYASFEATVSAMNAAGAFQPSVAPAAPTLPIGQLSGTIAVSLGAFRNLGSVDSSQTGLPLPEIGNFPGRIDLGFVIDRNGNFGLEITARGPLAGVPAGVASANVIGGDVRIEVSNATSIAQLNGTRVVEGLTQGTGLSGGLESSINTGGVSTFAASVGNGAGLEFGTGVAYTQVIPLGNAFALIPEYPKTS